jgi:hypothetical protein
MSMRALWEILVPTISNVGKPIRLRHHRVWDAHVRKISGGLTVLPVAKGQWMHEGGLYAERMIPVRFMATRIEAEKIVDMTIKHYDQKAVMAYKVAEEVILKHRGEQ